MKNTKEKLEAIYNRFSSIQHNNENFSIGGGLDNYKYASKRHEDAQSDPGKITLGEATQLFKKATGLDSNLIKEVLKYAIPNMEWHHAGFLPKTFGGGMKKTYFLNASEICNCAKNWVAFSEKLTLSKVTEKNIAEEKNNFEQKRFDFLQTNAKKIERVAERPKFFYLTAREMNGKYGWFDSSKKNYNMPEFFSGWEFENEEKYREFLNLQ